MPRFEKQPSEYVEKLVSLNRVSKTVKGGRPSARASRTPRRT